MVFNLCILVLGWLCLGIFTPGRLPGGRGGLPISRGSSRRSEGARCLIRTVLGIFSEESFEFSLSLGNQENFGVSVLVTNNRGPPFQHLRLIRF